MQIIETKYVVKAPAGEYYLGDPCYAFDHATWRKLLDDNKCLEDAIARNKNGSMVAFGTKHGDGTYRDTSGGEYPVDSGTIGLVPLTMCDQEGFDPAKNGRKVKFGTPVKCYEADGVLHFGPYTINTDD